MKKIITGRRFDTATATLIAETDNLGSGADSRSDFAFWEAALYRTARSGVYFLAGRGGAMSMFSRKVGTSEWTGGADIIPFDDKAAAFEWAQQHLSHMPDVIEGEFSDLIAEA